jgi:hypothetical protein
LLTGRTSGGVVVATICSGSGVPVVFCEDDVAGAFPEVKP